MKTALKYVGICAGAPIVSLWVGGATAWAAPETSEDTSDAAATQQTNDLGGFGVSVGDAAPFNIGNATARSSGSSMAVAFNLPGTGPSTATANGEFSFALAIDGSTARANGNGNFVFAGMDSTAIAEGNNNDVRAAFGSRNRVVGNGNTSYAIPESRSRIINGDNNVAVSLCGGSVRISGQSDRMETSVGSACSGG